LQLAYECQTSLEVTPGNINRITHCIPTTSKQEAEKIQEHAIEETAGKESIVLFRKLHGNHTPLAI